MKIGIATIFDAMNYGSFLQAFASQSFLSSLGHDVYFLDLMKTKNWFVKFTVGRTLSHTLFKIRRYGAYKKDWKELRIEKKSDDTDVFFIGSDEVWNDKNKFFTHAEELYGYNLDKKVIAYAPSIGYTEPDFFLQSAFQKDGIKNNFTKIFPRDDNTKRMVEAITGKKTNKVVDPTVLLFDKWENFCKSVKVLPEKYLLYYSYKTEPSYKKTILSFAHSRGLKVVGVGFDYKWTDSNVIASPFEFLYLIKHAVYVFTGTFHGSVFSTLLESNFIVDSSGQKVMDFLESFGLSSRIITDFMQEEFERKYNEKIDYEAVNEKLSIAADKSKKLITEALNE